MSDTDCVKKRGRPRAFERDQALAQALELFLEKGYEGASLDDLTDRMGINKPSMYSAFGNKEALFCQVLDQYYANYRNFFEELSAKQLPLKQTLSEWLQWFLYNFGQQKDPFGCLIVNSTTLCNCSHSRIADKIKEFHQTNQNLLTDFFRSAQEKGELQADLDPKALSQFCNTLVQGMAVLRRGQDDLKALEGVVELALQMIASTLNESET